MQAAGLEFSLPGEPGQEFWVDINKSKASCWKTSDETVDDTNPVWPYVPKLAQKRLELWECSICWVMQDSYHQQKYPIKPYRLRHSCKEWLSELQTSYIRCFALWASCPSELVRNEVLYVVISFAVASLVYHDCGAERQKERERERDIYIYIYIYILYIHTIWRLLFGHYT